MTSFWETVDPATFADLPAEEAGLAILRWWNDLDQDQMHPLVIHNQLLEVSTEERWRGPRNDATLAVLEGWAWLVSAALVMVHPSSIASGSTWFMRTRRGRAIGRHLTETAARALISLSRDLLHPALQAAPWEFFGRGYFDSAVFEASKAVEVRVRKLGGFPDSLLGRDLMRQAFKLNGGPLCDPAAVRGEQESMADLFAGAIGIFKNPTSHRDEVIATANEAAEALMTASHLMRVLDRVELRLAGTGQPGTAER